jgi:hypothetical protein
MTAKTAYLAFLAESPLCGLRLHPSWAPQDTIKTLDAAGYIEALGAQTDRAKLDAEVAEDFQDRLQEVKEGNLEDTEDADLVFEIAVHDDGRIEVIDDTSRDVLAEYAIAEVYEAFGMKMPTATNA